MLLSLSFRGGLVRRCSRQLTELRQTTSRLRRSSRAVTNGQSDDELRDRFGIPVEEPAALLTTPLEEISARPEIENRVQMTAFLARDPEFFEYKTGTYKTVLSIGLLNRRTRRNQWFEAHIWGPMALSAKEHLHKGEEIYLLGKLQQEAWTDAATGRNRSKVTILTQSIKKLRNPVARSALNQPAKSKTDPLMETLKEIGAGGDDDTVNPYDASSDDEGNLKMPPAVKNIIWSTSFPEMHEKEWMDFVNNLDIDDMWKLLFQRPKEFWDYRHQKRRRKTEPSFRHLLTERLLWLNRKTTPDWARFNIKFLGTTALHDI